MSGLERDTIAAIATPPGSGGIGVVRLSGPQAIEIGCALVGRKAAPARVLTLAEAVDAVGDRLDEVLVVAMPGPASFTGEDVFEVHGHGGSANMARLLSAVCALGARRAEAGEFSRRAFENGRLDLTRAEAIAGVIEASSERALRLSQAQLAGGLGERVSALRERCVSVLAELEASIDFPEEGIEERVRALLVANLDEVEAGLAALVTGFAAGVAVRDGVDVAIVGPVNAGKSSLLNALVGSERALVAEDAGTTRDYVEAEVAIEGIVFRLIDTAGERSGESDVERRGIELGRRRADAADVVLRLSAADGGSPDWGELGPRDVRVSSKCDLAAGAVGAVAVSVVSGVGLEQLRDALVRRAVGGVSEGADGAVVVSERQRGLVVAAREAVLRARAAVADGRPVELAAADLQLARTELSRVLGEDVGDDVLDELFARFCIGK